jgi:starch synthase
VATKHDPRAIKVLHVSPEAVPFCKVGGLADVAGSLPPSLRNSGADCRLLLPAWDGVLDTARKNGLKLVRVPRSVDVAIRWKVHKGTLWMSSGEGLPVYFLESPFFEGKQIYPQQLDPESVLPFVFLSLAALELADAAEWDADVLHCHDWGTAPLISALLWHRYYRFMFSQYKTVFTIHNLAHQGLLPLHSLRDWGLVDDAFTLNGLEFYGGANLMKGAITGASAVTTVSPAYSREIQTENGGVGLGGLLRSHNAKIHGILNGLDTEYWNPATDSLLFQNYSPDNLAGKAQCRNSLLDQLGWKEDGRPLFTSVGRMVDQKGFDILLPAIQRMVEWGCRLYLVGSGQHEYETAVREAVDEWPDAVASFVGYDEEVAHKAYAAGDFFLMPSKFEPCGLSQLISLRYGALPVVRSVGGLADTVFEYGSPEGNGFLFSEYSAEGLLSAVGRSLDVFRNDATGYRSAQKKAMQSDFSWDRSAPLYLDLYRSLLP